jgi:hypothetical protein
LVRRERDLSTMYNVEGFALHNVYDEKILIISSDS